MMRPVILHLVQVPDDCSMIGKGLAIKLKALSCELTSLTFDTVLRRIRAKLIVSGL
jgi:hypothetical protein